MKLDVNLIGLKFGIVHWNILWIFIGILYKVSIVNLIKWLHVSKICRFQNNFIWILSNLHKKIFFLVHFGFFSRSFYNLHYAIQLNKRSCSIFYKTLSLTQISKTLDCSSQQSISNYFSEAKQCLFSFRLYKSNNAFCLE